MEDMKLNGFSAAAAGPHFDVKELKAADYSCRELKDARLSSKTSTRDRSPDWRSGEQPSMSVTRRATLLSGEQVQEAED